MLSRFVRCIPARLFHLMVDRLDQAFDYGRIEGRLPDGSVRTVGGRGPGPDARVTITDWVAIVRLLLWGSTGWFHAWMDRQWASDDPVALIAAFSANRVKLTTTGRARGPVRWLQRLRHWRNRNTRRGAARNIHAHYDLGNDFYASWLDSSMTYSSAMFDASQLDEPLEQAQQRKIDALLARLELRQGDRLLEIGCGWGALGRRAIDRHNVDYAGLTISSEQAYWAQHVLSADGNVLLCDYRDHHGQYDAIASVEMVEAVGAEYWSEYLGAIRRLLRTGGRAAIQFITIDDAIWDEYQRGADFIQTYIFPGGCLISSSRFRTLAAKHGLAWEDEHHFPLDYAQTLCRWRFSFDNAVSTGTVPPGFDERFCRLWRYYLMYCEAGFRGGGISVAQVTLIKREE